MRSFAALVTMMAWLAAFAAPAGAQDFLDSYKAGVDAVQSGDFTRAETLMRRAIAGRSEESAHLIRYFHFRPYLPHFYLGLALAGRGDCAGALTAWKESERQGVIDGLPDERAVLQERRQGCQERLARETEVAERRREVQAAIDLADQTWSELQAFSSDPDLAPAWDEGELSLASRLEEAGRQIAQARQALAEAPAATLSPGDFDRAADLARGAGAKLQILRKEIDLRLQSAAESKEDLRQRLEGLRGSARQELDATAGLAPYPPQIAERRAALQAAIDASSSPDLSLPALKEARARLESTTARLRTAARPPPALLVEAAAAWLRGDPAAVLAALHGARLPEPRAQAHAELLQAAARFDLYRAGGSKDDRLLAAARDDVLAARRLDPSLAPLPKAFPPPFIRFFENPGPPPAAGAEVVPGPPPRP